MQPEATAMMRARRALLAALATVGMGWGLTACGGGGAAPAPKLGLLVPAYFHPQRRPQDWTRLAAAAARLPLVAIVNPANGPGVTPDAAYAPVIAAVRAAGARVVGYVYTQRGARALATVQAEVAAYTSLAPLDGIFIDEMAAAATPATLAYYQALAASIRSQGKSALIVGNPGAPFDVGLYDANVADVFIDLETDAAAWASATQAGWVATAPATRFAEIAYGAASSAAQAGSMAQRHLAWVYATTLPEKPNPFASLPDDFESMVAALAAINATR